MKAATNRTYGTPDVLKIESIDKPLLADHDILIKVHYSGVNRTDDGFLRAHPFVTRLFSGLTKPKHPVLGCEFAGEVVEVGSKAGGFSIGDRVFGFDDVRWGGHAEYKAIDARKSVVKIPEHVSYQIAGIAGEGSHYAYCYIMTIRKLQPSRILVHGATGAIGSAAVQLMKAEGWYVVATAPTSQLSTVKKLGADKVIDWQKTDFTQCGESFDVVFDSVGKSSFALCKKLLLPKGVYIATELGRYGQNPWLGIVSPLYKLFGAKRVLFPLPRNNKQIMEVLASRLSDGSFRPLIDRTYNLEDIKDAYLYVEAGQKIGNVSIRISE
jgi:NADPH:quinone reductase-like Zn-dependent oxidoreductase